MIAEALENSGIDERNMRLGLFDRFLAALHARMPEELDRNQVIVDPRADVMRRLIVSLNRDLKAAIGRTDR